MRNGTQSPNLVLLLFKGRLSLRELNMSERDFGFTPKITLREGLRKFAEWYASFYMPKD